MILFLFEERFLCHLYEDHTGARARIKERCFCSVIYDSQGLRAV